MSERLYDAEWMAGALGRLADAALAEPCESADLVIAGVRTRGASLAGRLAALLASRGHGVPVGLLDVTPYRDDLASGDLKALKGGSEMTMPIDGKVVIIVDDVLSTGRTARAALDLVMDFGRPRIVRLYTLIERKFRELPISADVTGAAVDAPADEVVRVHVAEVDGKDEVVVERPGR